jgi:hypothetical protein
VRGEKRSARPSRTTNQPMRSCTFGGAVQATDVLAGGSGRPSHLGVRRTSAKSSETRMSVPGFSIRRSRRSESSDGSGAASRSDRHGALGPNRSICSAAGSDHCAGGGLVRYGRWVARHRRSTGSSIVDICPDALRISRLAALMSSVPVFGCERYIAVIPAGMSAWRLPRGSSCAA